MRLAKQAVSFTLSLEKEGKQPMAYKALYREWRPQTFTDLVGQEHISRSLQNAIKNSRIAHAYLFSGPRGTGKTSTAKIMAKAVNCLQHMEQGEPCNSCVNCESITTGRSLDVLEIDAASNRGIDEIREIRERVNFVPSQGKYKVYIVDEVHMLTTEAFNALLKTLEEPPAHVIFILATTEPHKIPATILSRCQRYDFHKISPREIGERLQEILDSYGVACEEGVLPLIVKKAEGGLRDAISILDQCLSLGEKRITKETAYQVLGTVKAEALEAITYALAEQDAAVLLVKVNELLQEGVEAGQLIKDLLEHLRNIMLLLVAGPQSQLVTVGGEEKERLLDQAGRLGRKRLTAAIALLAKIDSESRWRQNMRIVLEMSLNSLIGEEEPGSPIENQPAKSSKTEHPRPKPVAPPEAKKAELAPRPAEATALELGELKKQWPQIMEGVKECKKTVHAFLTVAEPWKTNGKEVELLFKSGYTFHKEKVEDSENKKLIEGILEKVTGMKLKLTCVMEEEQPEADFADPVQKALDIFGPGVVILKD